MALAALKVASGAVVCPKCECQDFRIYRTTQGQVSTFRYKECRNCGHKLLTTTMTQERVIRSVDERNSAIDIGISMDDDE